ncbi:MAG: AraC family transcriptional regulator [Planctomycetes bacterium]|nr:AraC family transcriptional regulator [Planctomycetota bacterium]
MITLFQLSAQSRLPTLSRILHMRGRGYTGLRSRVCSEHEFHFVKRGRLIFEIDGNERVVHAGELFYSPRGTSYGLSDHAPPDLSCYHCHFMIPDARITQADPDSLWSIFGSADAKAAGRDRTLCLMELIMPRSIDDIAQIFLSILHDQRGTSPGDALAAQARFLLLLWALSREVIESQGRVEPRVVTSAEAHVRRALDIIQRHPGKHTTLASVSDLVGVNPDYLARLFRKHIGCTVGSYVQRRTIAVAQERLLSEATPVKRIAKGLGFSDPLYFARVFRRAVGCSPREFRNR